MADDGRAKRIRFEVESRHQELPLAEDGGGGEDGGPDLISRLPDEVLGDIISFLPTRDGARTQAISRRWRPLWRAAPLNLDVNGLSRQDRKCIILATKILSEHTGPGRRFSLRVFRDRSLFAKIDRWLGSQALTGLREIDFSYDAYEMDNPRLPQPMPASVLRFAPTLCVAKFACCDFPNEMVPELNFPHLKELSLSHVTISEEALHSLLSGCSALCVAKFGWCDFPNEMVPELNFPHLKELSLCRVTISEEALHSLLSGCSVLETLSLLGTVGVGRLRISSPTLRSIDFSAPWWSSDANDIKFTELVIKDAPCLERLLPLFAENVSATVRVMHAPKLEIVGMLSARISKLVLGTTVFQEMIALKLTSSMRTVKVLALHSFGPNLRSVVDFLKCFPCVEKLYVTCTRQKTMKNALTYNSLDPIECLEVHLKRVVMNDYHGMKPDVDFAKFFVLNAKVLEEMDFGVRFRCNDKWMANQRRRLQVDNKASPGARFAFGPSYGMNMSLSISKRDPFEWRNLEFFRRNAKLLN